MDQKTEKRILAGLALLGVASGVFYLGTRFLTKTLIKEAMGREEPKSLGSARQKLFDQARDAEQDYYSLRDQAIINLKNTNTKTVHIESYDGLTLLGHFLPCKNMKRIVLCMHGWRSSWVNDFALVVPFLHANNCGILLAEQRGQNLSEGDHIGFGVRERHDVISWINYLNERGGKNYPIYPYGVSMGAATVLMASDMDLPSNVKGIVADCGFTSIDLIAKHVMNSKMHLVFEPFENMLDQAVLKAYNTDVDETTTTQALQNAKVPVLFIHGTDDNFVPIQMTYDNYKACTSEKRLLVVPGAGHAMSYYTETKNYENELIHFFFDYDE